MLVILNGNTGTQRGHDVIQSVVDALIKPDVQAEYTWCGKTNIKNVRKKKFNALKQIHELVWSLCHLADSAYIKSDFRHDLVYKVMKGAHSRWYGNLKQCRNIIGKYYAFV